MVDSWVRTKELIRLWQTEGLDAAQEYMYACLIEATETPKEDIA